MTRRPQAMSLTVEITLAQIIARDVATGVQMATSLGYKMPGEFNVGLQVVSVEDLKEGQATVYQIRLNDALTRSSVLLPYTNGLTPLPKVSHLFKAAMARLRNDAYTAVHAWIEKHPQDDMNASAAKEALVRLARLADDDELSNSFAKECAETAKRFKYSVKQ